MESNITISNNEENASNYDGTEISDKTQITNTNDEVKTVEDTNYLDNNCPVENDNLSNNKNEIVDNIEKTFNETNPITKDDSISDQSDTCPILPENTTETNQEISDDPKSQSDQDIINSSTNESENSKNNTTNENLLSNESLIDDKLNEIEDTTVSELGLVEQLPEANGNFTLIGNPLETTDYSIFKSFNTDDDTNKNPANSEETNTDNSQKNLEETTPLEYDTEKDVAEKDTGNDDIEKDDTENDIIGKDDNEKDIIPKDDTEQDIIEKDDTEKAIIEKDDAEKDDIEKGDTEKDIIPKDDTEKDIIPKDDTEKDIIEKDDTEKAIIVLDDKDDAEKNIIEKVDAEKDGLEKDIIEKDDLEKDDAEKDDETSSEINNDPVFVQVNEDKDDDDDKELDKDDESDKNPIEIEGENNREGDPMETDDEPSRNETIENDDDSQRDDGNEFEAEKEESDKEEEDLDQPATNPLATIENDLEEGLLGGDTEFVPVDGEKDDKEEDDKETPIEEDPIASVGFEPINETQEGADEELCIIPDTERVISQAEKDAASSIAPLRDLLEANENSENATDNATNEIPPAPPAETYVISKSTTEDLQTCAQCVLQRKVKFEFLKNDTTQYICNDNCLTNFKKEHPDKCVLNWECEIRVKDLTPKHNKEWSFERKCATCDKKVDNQDENLMWEIMDFCSVACLSKYQIKIGSNCSNCSSQVRSNSLGKYCVRFGNDIRQFCTSHCLEEYKKGLKVCSYCHQDISGETDGFLAPVGDKGQFKDFCSKLCMDKYDILTNNRPPQVSNDIKCSVCKTDNEINIEFELDKTFHYFCSDRCFIAFSFVNNITSGKCSMCRRYFSNEILRNNTMFYDNIQYSFCSNSCQNIYIIAHRKIVPCVWCKVKKYNFDMIRRYFKNESLINMCSLNCLSLFQLSVDAVNSKKTTCNYCLKNLQPMYHLTMSDATIRNFCSYGCVISFQNQFKKAPLEFTNTTNDDTNTTSTTISYPVPTGVPKKNKKFNNKRNDDKSIGNNTNNNNSNNDLLTIPVISNVQSLASNNTTTTNNFIPVTQSINTNTRTTRNKSNNTSSNNNLINSNMVDAPIQVKHHILIRPAPIPDQRNVSTMCKVRTQNKFTSTTKLTVDKQIQTDECKATNILIPVPVPIYVPVPVHMYTTPQPTPLPMPIPIPVPLFIPTTRNSAKGIMKEIKKIQVKIPTDPYEAELLMMAEMVAGDKKEDNTDSESEVDDAGNGAGDDGGSFSPEPVDATNTFGDDMLQMALKMATELDEPAVDLEGALTANTITAPQGSETTNEENVDDPSPIHNIIERQSTRGRKRSRGSSNSSSGRQSTGTKKRRMSHNVDIPIIQPAPPPEPVEKPDAHLCLKYTFGVNAWKQWVTTKNAELEKTSKYPKLFKTEILQLTADELNYSLCLFVKEVRKPNGAEYAPDTIYYLCLGIQQYLFENSRIDNIFCDPYYEQFTDSLDEVARKFSVLYNDSHYIVTRVEEEHLWESKQLGAHSPHVLLSTLMFFNTKHFNLTTVQEHMQLSFSHIMKHWKRNPNQSGVSRLPGSRNVLLRFYPPQTAIQNNVRKKKVYEQQENEENPLRCPVKLYEFYLSKCPESVKTRNDVFYLQPERSCVPDSPVWYSTTPLCQEALEKMLHRVKMVKEINVALLTS